MCTCIHQWVQDEAVPEDNPHRLVPVSCTEYIGFLERLVSDLTYRLAAEETRQVVRTVLDKASADSFSWETTTKRLVDLRERVHSEDFHS